MVAASQLYTQVNPKISQEFWKKTRETCHLSFLTCVFVFLFIVKISGVSSWERYHIQVNVFPVYKKINNISKQRGKSWQSASCTLKSIPRLTRSFGRKREKRVIIHS